MGKRERRGGTNEREAWRGGRGVWREAWWAWWPGEAGRRGRAGNERRGGKRETDRVRANGMNLKEGRTTVKDVVPGGHSKWRKQKKQKVKQYHKEPKDELTGERMGRTQDAHILNT